MPAVEHSFADPPPTHLYLDSDLVINYLTSSHPNHERANAFLGAVHDLGAATIYASPLVWLEFAQVTKSQAFRAVLDTTVQARSACTVGSSRSFGRLTCRPCRASWIPSSASSLWSRSL